MTAPTTVDAAVNHSTHRTDDSGDVGPTKVMCLTTSQMDGEHLAARTEQWGIASVSATPDSAADALADLRRGDTAVVDDDVPQLAAISAGLTDRGIRVLLRMSPHTTIDEHQIPAGIHGVLANRSRRKLSLPPDALTKREIQILQLLADGHTNRTAGAALGLSEDTVKTHLKHMTRRLGVGDRAGLVFIALQHGVVA